MHFPIRAQALPCAERELAAARSARRLDRRRGYEARMADACATTREREAADTVRRGVCVCVCVCVVGDCCIVAVVVAVVVVVMVVAAAAAVVVVVLWWWWWRRR